MNITVKFTHLVFSTLLVWYFIDILVNITLNRTTKIARLTLEWEAVSFVSTICKNWLVEFLINQ